MSGKPHSAGVTQVLDLLEDMRRTLAEVHDLQAKVIRLKSLEASYTAAGRKYDELLRSMDLATSGNIGWEGRMQWFLTELARQSAERALRDAKEGL